VSISPGSSGNFGGDAGPAWRPEPISEPRPKWFSLFVIIAVAALAGANIYLFTQLASARQSLAQANQKIQAHDEQIAKLEGSVSRTYKEAEQGLMALKGEVSSTRGQISQATKQVQTEVLSKTQQIAERLAAEQKAEVAKVGGEVEQLKTVASTTESKVGALSGEVSGVKTDVSSTKAELQRTIAELKSVRGDLGVQSGLVATNAQELAALKRLGERNYFEFNIQKSKQPQRIGTISVKLRSTDTKRNRYTLDVIADDKLTEKKDRTINEPVQFYVAKAKIPYEIVVNQVQKDRIVGYLATPKDQGR
jgi:chromosome segregation ATPase